MTVFAAPTNAFAITELSCAGASASRDNATAVPFTRVNRASWHNAAAAAAAVATLSTEQMQADVRTVPYLVDTHDALVPHASPRLATFTVSNETRCGRIEKMRFPPFVSASGESRSVFGGTVHVPDIPPAALDAATRRVRLRSVGIFCSLNSITIVVCWSVADPRAIYRARLYTSSSQCIGRHRLQLVAEDLASKRRTPIGATDKNNTGR